MTTGKVETPITAKVGCKEKGDIPSGNNFMNESLQEKRVEDRIPCKHPVSYKLMGRPYSPQSTEAVFSEAQDISNHGMRILTDRISVQVGSILHIQIALSDTNTSMPFLAQVRWVREEDNGYHQLGLTFRSAAQVEVEKILQLQIALSDTNTFWRK